VSLGLRGEAQRLVLGKGLGDSGGFGSRGANTSVVDISKRKRQLTPHEFW
jgi:hypothetical protein